MPAPMRNFMRTSFLIGLGMLLMAVLLEAVLQCLPVFSGLPLQPSNAQTPISRYVPQQHYVFSYGWAFGNARQGTINRQGFANSRDFSDGAQVLVVGNSFVESLMLDYPNTLQGQLEKKLGGAVLAAASSGNTLADTLELVRYYVPRTHPRTVVLLIDSGNMNGLLAPSARGHSHFVIDGNSVGVQHNAYVESSLKQLVSRSALARYVYYNLKLPDWLSNTLRHGGAAQAAAPALATAARSAVLDYYLSQLQAIGAGAGVRFVFVLDGERNVLYDPLHAKANWLGDNRPFLIAQLARYRFDVVDMQPVMAQHWASQRERLDFLPMDGHWNQVAQGLAAQQVAVMLAR